MKLWGNVLQQHIVPSVKNAYRPHLLRPSWLGFFVALILAAEGFLMTNLIVRQSNESFLAAVVPGEVIALTNAERSKAHTGTVAENIRLMSAAQASANAIAAAGSLSTAVSPWDAITNAGYNYYSAGENVAINFIDTKDVISAWMTSPSHKNELLNSGYADVGVGAANGFYQGEPATFVVQYLADPYTQSAAVAAVPQNVISKLISWIASEPLMVTQWILAVIAFVLLVLLIITFCKEVHIQSTHTLIAGGTVCAAVLVLLACNAIILEGINSGAQPANVLLGSEGMGHSTSIPTFATSTVRG